MTTFYRAALDTRNFEFEAYGDSEAQALAALHRGFDEHCRQHRMATEGFRRQFAEDITVRPVELGRAYRDREPLPEGRSPMAGTLDEIMPAYEAELESDAKRDDARRARRICAKWVDKLGLGFHPDTAGKDYSPPLTREERRQYARDMTTLFFAVADPYAVGVEAIKAWEARSSAP